MGDFFGRMFSREATMYDLEKQAEAADRRRASEVSRIRKQQAAHKEQEERIIETVNALVRKVNELEEKVARLLPDEPDAQAEIAAAEADVAQAAEAAASAVADAADSNGATSPSTPSETSTPAAPNFTDSTRLDPRPENGQAQAPDTSAGTRADATGPDPTGPDPTGPDPTGPDPTGTDEADRDLAVEAATGNGATPSADNDGDGDSQGEPATEDRSQAGSGSILNLAEADKGRTHSIFHPRSSGC